MVGRAGVGLGVGDGRVGGGGEGEKGEGEELAWGQMDGTPASSWRHRW